MAKNGNAVLTNSLVQKRIISAKKTLVVLLLSLTKAYRHPKFPHRTAVFVAWRDLITFHENSNKLFSPSAKQRFQNALEASTSTFGWFVICFIAISHYFYSTWLSLSLASTICASTLLRQLIHSCNLDLKYSTLPLDFFLKNLCRL